MGIKFGTDGWRAVLDKDFTEENVKRVTLAIGKYVADNFGWDKPILIGYDPRKMADEYSLECAEILKDKGFTVFYSSRIVPTPVLAYNALIKNACAIMFTASHNPPEYLGMKFIPDYAGPATKEITDEIVANLDIDYPKSDKSGALHKIDFAPKYYEHLGTLIDIKSLAELNTNIIFDGLYSASIGYFDEILMNNGIKFDSMHMFHDTNFGGGMPDPKPKFLKELIEKVKSNMFLQMKLLRYCLNTCLIEVLRVLSLKLSVPVYSLTALQKNLELMLLKQLSGLNTLAKRCVKIKL